MSEANGVIRIERRGRIKFALGDGEPVELDVVAVFDAWSRTDIAFRVNGDIPPERGEEYTAAARRHAQEYLKCNDLSDAEVWAFIARVTEQTEKLRDFFTAKTSAAPASPDSSTTVVTSD